MQNHNYNSLNCIKKDVLVFNELFGKQPLICELKALVPNCSQFRGSTVLPLWYVIDLWIIALIYDTVIY